MTAFSRRSLGYKVGVVGAVTFTVTFMVGFFLPFWIRSSLIRWEGLWVTCGYPYYGPSSEARCQQMGTGPDVAAYLHAVRALETVSLILQLLACVYIVLANCCCSPTRRVPKVSRAIEALTALGGFLGFLGTLVYAGENAKETKTRSESYFLGAFYLTIASCIGSLISAAIVGIFNNACPAKRNSPDVYVLPGNRGTGETGGHRVPTQGNVEPVECQTGIEELHADHSASTSTTSHQGLQDAHKAPRPKKHRPVKENGAGCKPYVDQQRNPRPEQVCPNHVLPQPSNVNGGCVSQSNPNLHSIYPNMSGNYLGGMLTGLPQLPQMQSTQSVPYCHQHVTGAITAAQPAVDLPQSALVHPCQQVPVQSCLPPHHRSVHDLSLPLLHHPMIHGSQPYAPHQCHNCHAGPAYPQPCLPVASPGCAGVGCGHQPLNQHPAALMASQPTFPRACSCAGNFPPAPVTNPALHYPSSHTSLQYPSPYPSLHYNYLQSTTPTVQHCLPLGGSVTLERSEEEGGVLEPSAPPASIADEDEALRVSVI